MTSTPTGLVSRLGYESARAEAVLRKTVLSVLVGLPAYLFALFAGAAAWWVADFVWNGDTDPTAWFVDVAVVGFMVTFALFAMGVAALHAVREVDSDE